ncbi:MAG TPA: hypothetical protein VFL47_17210, partial [Flavisolibacter sp.]|nr:hypothetical protein [Flavisolibacter sp.]
MIFFANHGVRQQPRVGETVSYSYLSIRQLLFLSGWERIKSSLNKKGKDEDSSFRIDRYMREKTLMETCELFLPPHRLPGC